MPFFLFYPYIEELLIFSTSLEYHFKRSNYGKVNIIYKILMHLLTVLKLRVFLPWPK